MLLTPLIKTQDTEIYYSLMPTPFGQVLLGSTVQGLCYMVYTDQEAGGDVEIGEITRMLQAQFPGAKFLHKTDKHHHAALSFFQGKGQAPADLLLHIQGTPFQLKVWNALLNTPPGSTTTYGAIARQIGHPGASRAVGTAIGQNPVACLIPCHRVIRQDGNMGGYRWGIPRKNRILAWESVGAECLMSTA